MPIYYKYIFIYKGLDFFNINLNMEALKKIEYKITTCKAERDSQVSKYGKKSYVSKLIDVFRSDKTPTSNYWLEVGE